jgi:hypothetical protein
MKCHVETDSGTVTIYSKDYHYQEDKVQFTEGNEAQNSYTRYIIEKTGMKRTKLTLEFYLKKRFPGLLIFNLTQKNKKIESFNRSLQNLDKIVKDLKIPTALDS